MSEELVTEISGVIKNKDDLNNILVTLVVLYVLKKKFEDNEGEWLMIAKKAKQFLKINGIANPDAMVRKITVEIK